MTGSVDGADTVSKSLIGPQQIADDSQTDTTGDSQTDTTGDNQTDTTGDSQTDTTGDSQTDTTGDKQTGGQIKQTTLDVDNQNLKTGVFIFYLICMYWKDNKSKKSPLVRSYML